MENSISTAGIVQIAPTIDRLRANITEIDSLSQEGFSNIAALAQLAIAYLELPEVEQDKGALKTTIKLIRAQAVEYETIINSEAGIYGCGFNEQAVAGRA